MAATELTHPTIGDPRAPARLTLRWRPARELIASLAVVWLLAAVGGVLGLLAPGLAPGGGPHPTLHGSVSDVLSILATNLRLLSVPFALGLLGFHRGHRARRFGDLLVGAVVTVNALRVGLALGRYGTRLIPYIPQLPVEWLALALSTSAWIATRRGAQPHVLRTRALQTLAVAAAAARSRHSSPHTRDETPTPLAPVRALSALTDLAAAPPPMDPASRWALRALPLTAAPHDPPPQLRQARPRTPR